MSPFASLLVFAAPILMALTFDDLPAQTYAKGKPSVTESEARVKMSTDILRTLREHKAPAAVFVNCDNLVAEERLLEAWRDAGHELANHTASHIAVHRSTQQEWSADVERCDAVLRKATGGPVRYFRFPYLRHGADERKTATHARLSELGYTIAPVSMATSEWHLAASYHRNLDDDEVMKTLVQEVFVSHMVESLEQAQKEIEAKTGRTDVPHIALLHVNELNADGLDAVLDAFEAKGVEFVSLETAMADPFYKLPDAQTLNKSMPWQLRIEPAWTEGDPQWWWEQEGAFRERWPEP